MPEHRKRICIIADLHAGCRFSPWPMGDLEPRMKKELNPVQKFLTQKWMELPRIVGPLDYLIFNGDMVHGSNGKNRGWWAMETSITRQKDAAVVLCRPLRRAVRKTGKVFVTFGTGYHEGEQNEAAESFASELKAEECKFIDADAWPAVNLTLDGVGLFVTHKQGNACANRPGELERHMQAGGKYEQMVGPIDVMVASHTHVWASASNENRQAFSTPGWQGYSFWDKSHPLKYTPILFGMLLIDIYPERKRQGLLVAEYQRITWPFPRIFQWRENDENGTEGQQNNLG